MAKVKAPKKEGSLGKRGVNHRRGKFSQKIHAFGIGNLAEAKYICHSAGVANLRVQFRLLVLLCPLCPSPPFPFPNNLDPRRKSKRINHPSFTHSGKRAAGCGGSGKQNIPTRTKKGRRTLCGPLFR